MITGLRYRFLDETPHKADIATFSQEHYDFTKKEKDRLEPYPGGTAAYAKDCALALEEHFIKVNDHKNPPSSSPGPVVNEITSRTLLYTPYSICLLLPRH